MNRNLPRYRARTLFKDVLKEYPDIVDFTLPNLEGLTDESAGNIKHFLFDCLERHYRNSEIATYYADEFVGYFQGRWYSKVVKYVPLLKAKLTTENNINIGEDFTASKNVNTIDKAGKTVNETYTRDNESSTSYGRSVDNTVNNTNTRNDTSEATTSNTQNNTRTENTTDNREDNTTKETNTTNNNTSHAETTQYERQITNADTTSNTTTESNETGSLTSENTHNGTITDNNKNDGTENISVESTSKQTGSYNTQYGGKDTTTDLRNDTRQITNGGEDTITETQNQNYKRMIYDYGRISAMIGSPDIVDDFVGDFASLFMEVFV